ncbi:RNA-directed DNA polymerase [Brucella inopinata]|uniref:RNA-directed DNA polymerase n=1 Tax=Brucella inopinata TaxID=1218315 RepID=UPI0008710805|nr:RNA-directed DNA polymerase [Brucella inopinata]SCD24002.1 hypothetical protein BR141012304_11594 [Brucella inopinata]
MRDQFMCDGIENFDFHVSRKVESQKLSHLILSGDYVPQKAQRILVEKSKGLCRQLVIPSIRDAIVLQCLSDALYSEIKGKAPTSKAFFEPKDHKFSSPPSGYGTFAAWLNFQKELFEFSKTRKFVVVTDIANYYDSISYVHLRNAIASISGVDECVIDMLIYVLGDLLWQPDYTPRIEVGLPQINLDAPRLLAHCFLYELDSYLASDLGRDFVRYMDDIDIGVDTIVDAKRALKTVDLVLQTKQVRLNSGKTVILTRLEAIRHFRIFENARLDSVQASVDHRVRHGLPLDRQRTHVEARIRQGLRKKSFDAGNGEKVLKRWLGLAAKTGAVVKPEALEDLVKRRPSVRENVYSFIRSRPLTPSIAGILARASQSGLLVDDAAMVEMSNYLVETFVKNKRCHAMLEAVIASNDPQSYFGLYSRLWLLSKYGTPAQILTTLRDARNIWSPHERLGRLAASFMPLFHGSPEETPLKRLLGDTLNSGVRDTYKFHMKLATDLPTFKAMFDALKAPNPSRGTGITHAKFLCLLSALKNPAAPVAQITTLRANHSRAFEDAYYKEISKRVGV